MLTLAIDTTNTPCGVAIARDDTPLYEAVAGAGRQHAAQLLPMIDAALNACGLTARDIDRWACAVGPGSFTGVRIGVSAIRGFAHALDAPCAAVNALEALAFGVEDALAAPMFDARRGQVYAAAYLNGKRVLPDIAIDAAQYLPTLADKARELGVPVMPLGEGAAVNAEALTAVGLPVPNAMRRAIRPLAIALLAHQSQPMTPEALVPYYLRLSQAEQAREAKARQEAGDAS